MTASLNGARALAVSLDVEPEPGTEQHGDTAVAVAATLSDRLAAMPAGTVLNLNVPNRAEVGTPRRAGPPSSSRASCRRAATHGSWPRATRQ
ncbi:5'/3'-nucleotidase SurE [Amycolatopsis sp. NPDC024027]|uniref:5'/3'-nucleotidase SurE n=1 Tax=Amycolatopsis sp. NPDC024027 TaxID=3154327 RepID=UPI0033C4F181